jgi:hypothetical protein
VAGYFHFYLRVHWWSQAQIADSVERCWEIEPNGHIQKVGNISISFAVPFNHKVCVPSPFAETFAFGRLNYTSLPPVQSILKWYFIEQPICDNKSGALTAHWVPKWFVICSSSCNTTTNFFLLCMNLLLTGKEPGAGRSAEQSGWRSPM